MCQHGRLEVEQDVVYDCVRRLVHVGRRLVAQEQRRRRGQQRARQRHELPLACFLSSSSKSLKRVGFFKNSHRLEKEKGLGSARPRKSPSRLRRRPTAVLSILKARISVSRVSFVSDVCGRSRECFWRSRAEVARVFEPLSIVRNRLETRLEPTLCQNEKERIVPHRYRTLAQERARDRPLRRAPPPANGFISETTALTPLVPASSLRERERERPSL